jgi:LPXTG-motif cell wall-anchored protein
MTTKSANLKNRSSFKVGTESEDVTATTSDDNDESGSTLPDTATNIYTFLLIGAITFIAGVSITLFRKRKAVN